MFLMNGDKEVLWFDKEDFLIKIIDNSMLPFQLRDNIEDSDCFCTPRDYMMNYDKLRHFFADRVLSLSRENAKSILQSIDETQKLTEENSYQLSLRCRGLSISDNFWVKGDEEQITFSDVNLRNRSLNDVIFQVSMKGTPVSLQHNILAADIASRGMFRKTWVREEDGLFLYKSDYTTNNVNTKSEIEVSEILDASNVHHVRYTGIEKDDVFCCKCKCFTSDDISFVEAEYVKGWLERQGIDFIKYIHENFERDFANMVVCDYIFANPDEHINNWGFLVDNITNGIISLAPIFDNNQALIAIQLGKEEEFDSLIYDPTGKTTLDSALEWYPYADVKIVSLPAEIQIRLDKLDSFYKEISHSSKFKESEKIII